MERNKKSPEVLIMSRENIEGLAKMPFSKKTAVISITDADYFFAELKHQPAELLQVAFDDVDNDVFEDELGRAPTEEERVRIEKKYNMLSDEQAKEIADFCLRVLNDVEVIICHCEHGQSRSAAVAAAIIEYTTHNGIKIFADDNYFPNKVVFRKVYAALNEKVNQMGETTIPIEDLNLSVRAFSALKRAGIDTVGGLTYDELEKRLCGGCVRNLGRKTLEEVTSKLDSLGLLK